MARMGVNEMSVIMSLIGWQVWYCMLSTTRVLHWVYYVHTVRLNEASYEFL